MGPDAIISSPPSTICSPVATSPSTPSSSRRTSQTPLVAAATQLPFPEIRRIMGYAQEELEAVSFTVLEKSDPDLLEAKDIDCADG